MAFRFSPQLRGEIRRSYDSRLPAWGVLPTGRPLCIASYAYYSPSQSFVQTDYTGSVEVCQENQRLDRQKQFTAGGWRRLYFAQKSDVG